MSKHHEDDYAEFQAQLDQKDAMIVQLRIEEASLACDHSKTLEVLKRLVDKLDAISNDGSFKSMFTIAATHGMEYSGPNWITEMADAKSLLDTCYPSEKHNGMVRREGWIALYENKYSLDTSTYRMPGVSKMMKSFSDAVNPKMHVNDLMHENKLVGGPIHVVWWE